MRSYRQPDFLQPHYRLAVAAAAVVGALMFPCVPLISDLERHLHDLRVRWVAHRFPPSDRIVRVEIDEETLRGLPPDARQRLGGWHGLAALLDICRLAKAIGIDLIHAQPEPPGTVDRRNDEDLLRRKIRELGNVYLATYLLRGSTAREQSAAPIPSRPGQGRIRTDSQVLANWPVFTGPMPRMSSLRDGCRGIAHANAEVDDDGAVRRYRSVLRVKDHVIPSLGLAMAIEGLGFSAEQVRLDADGRLRLGSATFPLQPDGTFFLCPPARRGPAVSAVDVLEAWGAQGQGSADPGGSREWFRDKLVLIGGTAPSIEDDDPAPGSVLVPGLWLHASAAQNLLEGVCIRELPGWGVACVTAWFALGAVSCWGKRPRVVALAAVGFIGLYVAAVLVSAYRFLVMMPVVEPAAAGLFALGLLQSLHWAQERSRRQCLQAMDYARQQVTDMLAHDLKNSVAPILMSLGRPPSDDAGARGDPAEEAFWRSEFPEIVWTSSNKLMTQINALVDIRRLREGKMPLHPKPCEADALLDRAIQAYRIPTRQSDLRLERQAEGSRRVRVRVDPEIFDRIMGNLIWNAIKVAREQSTIQVGVRAVDSRWAEFFVANEGRILPDDVRSGLFTASAAGSETLDSTSAPAAGLGLAFCKLAVEAHEGRIELDSPRPGCADGVEVRVRLARIEGTAGDGAPDTGS